jgi:pre-mRNA-splicing factor SYF2
LNHAEVVEEDHRHSLPTNYERRCERVQKQEEQIKRRREASIAGLDYDRVEQLSWTAEECDKWDKKKKKKNPDVGFDSEFLMSLVFYLSRIVLQLVTIIFIMSACRK